MILKYFKEKDEELSVLDESAFDDVFGEFETEELTNETKEQIADQEGTEAEELDKLAEDIESKAESEKEADLTEAISKADKLTQTLKPEKIIKG